MSLLNILRKTKNLISNSQNPTPVSANIDIEDNKVNFTINGIPSSINIQYEGAVSFQNLLPISIKSFVTKDRILITNIFKMEIPELLYSFQGKLKIISCKIMTYEGNIFLATINNNFNKTLLNTQETNFEDDSIILQEEYEQPSIIIRRGQASPKIKLNARNSKGNIIIPPKDIDFIATTIYENFANNTIIKDSNVINDKQSITQQAEINKKINKQIIKPKSTSNIASPTILVDEKGKY